MAIKPEIQQRLGLGANEGEDMTLVEIRSGSDGVSQQSAAKSYVKREYGVRAQDIIDVEYAGWSEDNPSRRVMLVTWRTND